MAERLVLVPFAKEECLSIRQASSEAGVSGQSIRNWCDQYGLGRKIGAQLKVSKVALRMFLNGDKNALAMYHRGDRSSGVVKHYYACEGLADIRFTYLPLTQSA